MPDSQTLLPGLINPIPVASYVTAGNSTFTVVSRATGNRFTFKVQRPKRVDKTEPLFYVKVRVGAEYQYIGAIRPETRDGKLKFSASPRNLPQDAPKVKAFAWFMRNQASDQVEFIKSNRCCACGRELTTPESCAAGIGPDCATRI